MALVLAAIMVLAMSAVSFAADGTKTITLTGGKAGHTYTLYQVFKGSTTSTKNELINIQWGSDANATFKAAYDTAAAAAETMENGDARALAQSWISNNYLGSGTEKKLTADVNMALKGSAPTSEKKVDDKNDSDTSEDAVVWQDTADYDIGDAVPFQLKATTADNVAAYKKYHITFQDKQSAGLDAPESFTITVPGTEDTLTLAYNATSAVTKDVTFGTGDDAVTVTVTAEKATPATGNTFAIKISFETKPAGSYLPAGLNSQDIRLFCTLGGRSSLQNAAITESSRG